MQFSKFYQFFGFIFFNFASIFRNMFCLKTNLTFSKMAIPGVKIKYIPKDCI